MIGKFDRPKTGDEVRQDKLENFLKTLNFDLVSFKTPNGTMFVAVPNKLKGDFLEFLPKPYMQRILQYHHIQRLKGLNGDVNHGHCGAIASKAIRELPAPEQGRITGEGPKKGTEPMNFYKDRRYGYHVFNYSKIGPDRYLAFDLTSHITMFGEEGKSQIFALLGTSRHDLVEKLRLLTGDMKWELGR